MSGQSELDDLDELIAAGTEAMGELRRRRRELRAALGFGDAGELALREIAKKLHDQECRLAHEDQCAWGYEESWMKNPSTAPGGITAEQIWTDNLRAHHGWLETARRRVLASGADPERYLEEIERWTTR